jgi:lipopolysaccharide export system permease protein
MGRYWPAWSAWAVGGRRVYQACDGRPVACRSPTRNDLLKARPNPVRIIDRYILRELVGTFGASFVVLLMVSTSGLLVDLISKIARGKVPASLLLSQLGLRLIDVLPLLLPLALFLGVLLAYSRLYRDSEMAVLGSAGLGPRQLLRPLLVLALPVALLVGTVSLWLSPASLRASVAMIETANRSLLMAGLEPGRFIELPGRHSVVYFGEMSDDGTEFGRLFVHAERDGRTDLVTARTGRLFLESVGEERYLSLTDGFRVEGVIGQDDFRMMRFERNDIRVPDSEPATIGRNEMLVDSRALLDAPEPSFRAELHWRIGAPLATLALALLALPLSRTPPRGARYGRMMLALLAYIVYLNFLALGRIWLANGTLPPVLGLWWAHVPVVLIAFWLLWRDDRLPRPRGAVA